MKTRYMLYRKVGDKAGIQVKPYSMTKKLNAYEFWEKFIHTERLDTVGFEGWDRRHYEDDVRYYIWDTVREEIPKYDGNQFNRMKGGGK